METNRRRNCAWSYIVSSAKGGEEIVEGVFVGQIHHRQPRAPFVLIAVKDVVVANGDVEEIARTRCAADCGHRSLCRPWESLPALSRIAMQGRDPWD